MRGLTKCDWSWLSGSIILVLISIGLGIGWSMIYAAIIRTYLKLTPESQTYSMWIRTPLPMYLDIYLFNCTNAAEFKKNSSIKPNFQEIGPFVFQEVHDRVNVTWNANGSVSYNQTRNWTFIPELSKDLKVQITNLNVIALGVAHSTRYIPYVEQVAVDYLLRMTSELFVTKPANEWLFDGMNLTLLNALHINVIKKFVDIPFDKFGFFYDRNMSAAFDGTFEIDSGVNDIARLGFLNKWNSRTKTDFFDGNCAEVNGSSGEIFGPIPNNQTEYTMFITDVCSSLKLKYAEDYVVEGLTGKQFVGDETMFDNGEKVPEMKCFCDGECVPTGMRNMTLCRQGAPVFVSFPHFYLADPSYTAPLTGLSPNKSLHEFQFTLEPTTGIPLDVRARLQVNLLLDKYPMYKHYASLPRIFFPMLWFTQRAHLTPAIAQKASLLINLNLVGIIVPMILSALALLIIFGRGFCIWKNSPQSEDEVPFIDSNGDS